MNKRIERERKFIKRDKQQEGESEIERQKEAKKDRN